MNIRKLQKNWDRMGAKDPWWAILSHQGKRYKWDVEEFFATGRELVQDLLVWLQNNHVDFERGEALDFGCGAGRITQALAEHFGRVIGVDIAPSMIELAEHLNPLGDQCEFVLNSEPHLHVFEDESFDFVCSIIVLQHMEPRYMREYLQEFARIVRPGGAIAVQIPDQPTAGIKGRIRGLLCRPMLQPLVNIYRRIRNRLPGSMEMYGMKRDRVTKILKESGLRVARISKCTSAGPNWTSFRYLAVRDRVLAAEEDSPGKTDSETFAAVKVESHEPLNA